MFREKLGLSPVNTPISYNTVVGNEWKNPIATCLMDRCMHSSAVFDWKKELTTEQNGGPHGYWYHVSWLETHGKAWSETWCSRSGVDTDSGALCRAFKNSSKATWSWAFGGGCEDCDKAKNAVQAAADKCIPSVGAQLGLSGDELASILHSNWQFWLGSTKQAWVQPVQWCFVRASADAEFEAQTGAACANCASNDNCF
jgi:hypothetical protein